MEEYGKILVVVMPIFLLLIAIEKIYGYYKGNDTAPYMDTVSSISSGMTNSVKDVMGISVSLLSYGWLYSKIAIFHLEANILAYIIGFIAIDFYGYWTHRLAHQVNFFWNQHAIHHSSEEFNLACALRQSVSSFVKLFTFLLIPAALLGVPPIVIAITLPIQLFLQFWYHTQHIKKMGFLEKILVTPSHHRVHHAINPEYMDKNHSQIFIWDKLFGTFQEELESVPAVFGITRPAQTWNPIRINFQHLWLMISDAWRSEKWEDKFTIWFKPTGWRPENFEEKYPVTKIKNVYDFEKYGKTPHSNKLVFWSISQAAITLLFITYLFDSIAKIGLPNIFVYGTFIFITIYSYTELMDTRKFSVFWEAIRFLFGIAIIFWLGDWFGLNQIFAFANYIVIGYLVLSLFVTIYFVSINFEKKEVVLT